MDQVVFWRDDPLNQAESLLLETAITAHAKSTGRENVSVVCLRLAALGSGDYARALISALSSIGGPHAPIVQSYDLIASHDPASVAAGILARKQKVPGWGNGFVKGAPDPIWLPVDGAIRMVAPGIGAKLDKVTEIMRAKRVFPNPSVYTAATGLALRMRRELVPWIFVAGRLNAWTNILAKEGQLWHSER